MRSMPGSRDDWTRRWNGRVQRRVWREVILRFPKPLVQFRLTAISIDKGNAS